MLLVIDIGNTETVIGIYQLNQIKAFWRLSSQIPRTKDECWVLFKMLCDDTGIDFATINGVVLSSVVPSWTAVFQRMVSEYLDLQALVISSETDTGLQIGYEVPKQVGADRICNAVAGAVLYGLPIIIVDLGTAITFDVVSPENVYLGGIITLGLTGTSNGLFHLTAKLPTTDLIFPPKVVGRTTEQSIQSGIMWGAVSLIDGLLERIQNEMQWKKVQIVATGGMAPLIIQHSDRITDINEHLTLEGMRIIYQRLNGQL